MGQAAKTLQTSLDQVMGGYDLELTDPDDLEFHTCILARAAGVKYAIDVRNLQRNSSTSSSGTNSSSTRCVQTWEAALPRGLVHGSCAQDQGNLLQTVSVWLTVGAWPPRCCALLIRSVAARCPGSDVMSCYGAGGRDRALALSDLRLLLNQPPMKLGGSRFFSSCHALKEFFKLLSKPLQSLRTLLALL
jgi:hypothetical protein